jgi:hypothetical protein
MITVYYLTCTLNQTPVLFKQPLMIMLVLWSLIISNSPT